MEPCEQIYLLDEFGLLLLLSTLDDRPVFQFPLQQKLDQVPLSSWRHILFELVRENWMSCDTGTFQVNPKRAGLLKTIKNASQILTVYSKSAAFGCANLYLDDASGSAILVGDRGVGNCCLRVVSGGVQALLEDEDVLPGHPMRQTEIPALLGAYPSLPGQWEALASQKAPALEQPVSACWEQFPDARAVVDWHIQTQGEPSLAQRWVWLEETICPVVVQRDRETCRVDPDTEEKRTELFAPFAGFDPAAEDSGHSRASDAARDPDISQHWPLA